MAYPDKLSRSMAQFNLELYFRVTFLAVLLPLASGACVDLDLGLGTETIPNSDITSSSEQNANTPAEHGRLNYTLGSSWCAGTTDTNPYLQIDLKSLHIICAVSTQGNSQTDQWVKNYTLQISTDGTAWVDYKEGGQVKFLRGNADRNSEVKHVVYRVLTRYLRFLPQTHQGGVCMRTEVFGVKQEQTCKSAAIGLAFNGTIPDSSFSASSSFSNSYRPSFGRLNRTNGGWGPKTTTNPADYLQIDLLYEYVICAVATQGDNGVDEWTTNYKVQLSMDGITFVTYQESNVVKVFSGNSNRSGIIKNSLQEFASAKFIRFQPTAYHKWKILRVEVYGVLLTKVPSQPPTAFNLTASSSTSITASWQLPPIFSRHGRNIIGFKLFYREKGFAGRFSFLNITSGSTFSRLVTGLEKYTEYEFQVLAYTSDGDGPKSLVEIERTMEDAPSAPTCLSFIDVPPSNSHGPRVTLSWSMPTEPNGIITSYTLFYSHNGGALREISGIDKDASSYTVDALGGLTYQFYIRAVTFKPGPNETITVASKEYEPSRGPEEVRVSSSTVNSSRINVTWLGLPREVAYGKIIRYEVRLAVLENCKESQSAYHLTINTTTTYFHVTGLSLFAKYEVSVRGYTAAGPGPYSRPAMVQTLEKPVIKDLPKRTISAIGELVVLNCEVFGHPEASVIWTKDGLNSTPRAQLKDNGKVLVINNVAPADSGVYECKAMNMFGESYTTTTLIVAGPPSLLKELSPPSVLCEKQTLCSLSCHATSYTPFNYSWTKDGHVPVGDNIKLMNNSIIVTPLDAQDYGEYVCHVANGYGSTKYKITLFASKDNQDGGGTQSILLVSVIALSCLVVVSLIMNSVLIWQRKRAVPNERIQNQEKVDCESVKSSRDQQSTNQHASDSSTYMELKPRPSNRQCQVSPEYHSLQERPENPEYYNVAFQEENGGKQNEEVYEEV